MSMLDVLSVLRGWKYNFPTPRELLTVNTTDYITLYDSRRSQKEGGVIYVILITSSTDYNIKITLGNSENEVQVLPAWSVLYGQAPSGVFALSGLVANCYTPALAFPQYREKIWTGGTSPLTGVAMLASSPFPYKDGAKFEIQFATIPQTIYEFSAGFIELTDVEQFKESLKELYYRGD